MIKITRDKKGLRIFPEDIKCIGIIDNDVSIYLSDKRSGGGGDIYVQNRGHASTN